MSMEEWPDDHLDELFRKSAEEHDVPFNSADWTDMNRRLADRDRQQLYNRIIRWSGVGLLLLLLLGSLIWFTDDGGRETTRPVVTQSGQSAAKFPAADKVAARPQPTASPAPSADQLARRPNLVATPPAQTRLPTGTGTLAKQTQEKAPNASRLTKPLVISPTSADRPENRGQSEGEPQAIGSVAKEAGQRRHTYSTQKQPPQKTERVANRYVGGVAAIATDQSPEPPSMVPDRPVNLTREAVSSVEPETTAVVNRWLPELAPASSQGGLVQQVRSLPEPTPADVPAVQVARPLVRAPLRRLSVMLFASPDLSAIGLKNFERPGSNAGLVVQYQLSDRLSIHTGAMFSTKRYQTYSADYVWPSSWVWKVWPSEIIGTCRMIDVPLNVRYDWLVRPRPNGAGAARWFASTGLTSYFIQRETYVYEYDDPNDPNIMGRGWDNQRAGRPGGSFGFSNLNLSVGYERPITRRLSWQVEPFMKVPLQQVGFFRVKLLSTGAFAGLRYRL